MTTTVDKKPTIIVAAAPIKTFIIALLPARISL